MSYRSNAIRNLRTVKALRGEALKIDLGEEFQGTLEAWMKKNPNDSQYRAFEVQDGRYLYLTASQTSDYIEDGEITEAVEGKWYFDVEQDLNDGSDKKTIYRGTILFQNDITGSGGSEAIPPPGDTLSTSKVRLVSAVLESVSGTALLQQTANEEFATEIKLLKQAVTTSKPYKFSSEISGDPEVGYLTLNSDEFVSTTLIKSNEVDSEGLDNSYLFEGLRAGSSIILRGIVSGSNVVFTVNGEIIEVDGVYEIPVTHDNSVGGILTDEESIEIEGFSTGSGSVLERDIVVAGIQDGTIGVDNGDILPAGTSMTDSLEKILVKKISPTYYQPSVGLSVSPSSTQEVGATISYILTPSFTQNDAGDMGTVVFKRGGVVIQTQSSLNPFTDSNRTVPAGSTSYSVEINYSQGEVKDDNLGDPDDTGRIEAGSKTNTKSVSGQYRSWFGPNGNTPPADGDEIRNLSFSYSSTFTLNTGNTALVHVIAIPSTSSLVSVIDQDALNADITSNYTFLGTPSSVPDGSGNDVPYKVYALTIASAYTESHRHKVIIS